MEISDWDLNALLDGELPPDQIAIVVAWLTENPAAKARLRELAEHKMLLRIGYAETADAAAATWMLADRLAAAIERDGRD